MAEPDTGLRAGIINHVIRQILAGAWRSGDQLPSESQFVDQFGVSRMTVHHALRDLVGRGYLIRRKGVGSFVAPPGNYASRYGHDDIRTAILRAGGQHSAHVLLQAREPADSRIAGLFDCAPGSLLFHAILVHCSDGVAVELEDRHVDPAVLPDFLDIDLGQTTLFAKLMLSRPYREGSETVRPLLCSGDDQMRLRLPSPQVGLEITRRTWTADAVVTAVRLLRVGAFACLHGVIVADRPVAV